MDRQYIVDNDAFAADKDFDEFSHLLEKAKKKEADKQLEQNKVKPNNDLN